MNKRQKSIILNFVFIITITILFVMVMVNIRNLINKSEAKRAMELLSEQIISYHAENISLPSKSYIERQLDALRVVRLGVLEYRAQWISFDSPDDTILAYSYQNYGLFGGEGYWVMRLNGTVEWMGENKFETLLLTQQSQAEIDIIQKAIQP